MFLRGILLFIRLHQLWHEQTLEITFRRTAFFQRSSDAFIARSVTEKLNAEIAFLTRVGRSQKSKWKIQPTNNSDELTTLSHAVMSLPPPGHVSRLCHLGPGRLLKCLQWVSAFWPAACEPKRDLLCQDSASRPYPSVYSGFIFLQPQRKVELPLLRPKLLGHQKWIVLLHWHEVT